MLNYIVTSNIRRANNSYTFAHQKTLEIAMYGRGGQGIVTAMSILALAVHQEEREVLAFPLYNSEQRNGWVSAYIRLAEQPIYARNIIQSPDIVIIQDHSLLKEKKLLQGVNQNGLIILNHLHAEELRPLIDANQNWLCFSGDRIARQLGDYGCANSAMLGAFAAITRCVGIDSLISSMQNVLSDKTESVMHTNIRVLNEAYQLIAHHDEEKNKEGAL